VQKFSKAIQLKVSWTLSVYWELLFWVSQRVTLCIVSDISHHQLIPVEQLVIEEGHVSLVSWHADQVSI